MNTRLLILALDLLFVGCATPAQPPAPLPVAVTFEGARYGCLAMPLKGPPLGTIVAFRRQGEVIAGRIRTDRGDGVYRVDGEGLILVHVGNYVGQLIPLN